MDTIVLTQRLYVGADDVLFPPKLAAVRGVGEPVLFGVRGAAANEDIVGGDGLGADAPEIIVLDQMEGAPLALLYSETPRKMRTMTMRMRMTMMTMMTLMMRDNQRDTVWWLLIVLIDRDSRGRSPCGDMITLMIKLQ